MSTNSYNSARAYEIYLEIKELVDELDGILRRHGGIVYDRWKAYPHGHITIALDHDHDYLGKNTVTVKECVMDLDEDEDEDLDDDEDECDSDDSGLPGDSRGFPTD